VIDNRGSSGSMTMNGNWVLELCMMSCTDVPRSGRQCWLKEPSFRMQKGKRRGDEWQHKSDWWDDGAERKIESESWPHKQRKFATVDPSTKMKSASVVVCPSTPAHGRHFIGWCRLEWISDWEWCSWLIWISCWELLELEQRQSDVFKRTTNDFRGRARLTPESRDPSFPAIIIRCHWDNAFGWSLPW